MDGRLDLAVVGRRLARVVAAARTGDVVGRDGGLADLVLDLVDEATDVGRQVGRAGHGRRWYAQTCRSRDGRAATLRAWPIRASSSSASPAPSGCAACAACRRPTPQRRLEPMNSISWMVGHLAWHERLVWMERGQGLKVEPILDAVASGLPASTPVAQGHVGGLAAGDRGRGYVPRHADDGRPARFRCRTTDGRMPRPPARSSSASPTTTGRTSARPRRCARSSATSGWPSSSGRSRTRRPTAARTR